jgi:hypothetical protein
MTSAAFGTVGWARRGNGRMSRSERLREFASANRVLVRTAPAQLRMRLGLRNRSALSLDPDRIPLPDSTIAREAEAECREASPQRLIDHCFRTYAWGMLLAHSDGLRPDPELLYVGSMLHDLALTDTYRDVNPMPCFGARAGIFATEWAGKRGWSHERCRTLGDAISLHLNSQVDAAHGPEAQFLQAGAGLDVLGLRYWDLAPETIAAVLRRYPRGDFIAGLGDFEAEAHPGTRTHLLVRRLMFATIARHAPFNDAD